MGTGSRGPTDVSAAPALTGVSDSPRGSRPVSWKASVAAALPGGSRELWLRVDNDRCRDIRLRINELSAAMRVVLAVTGENVGTPRAQTFDRLSHQRRSPMYALSNLRR